MERIPLVCSTGRFEGMKWLRGGLLAVSVTSGACAAGQPADTLSLRIADSLPNGHVIHRTVTVPFMEEATRLSVGRVAFQHFPGEQLGKAKDLLALTQAGLAEVGYVVPSYQSDRMPLSAAMELPGIFTDYCQAARALWDLTHDDGYLERMEFAPNHVVPLVTFVLPPYQLLLSTSRRVTAAADLAGLKVRSAGGAMDFLIARLGMVSVRMTPPEVYEGLSRGTVDGAIFPYQSARSYSLGPVLTSGTIDAHFGTVVITYAISARRWRELAPPIRTALLEAGRRTSLDACTRFIEAEEAALSGLRDEGMQPTAWPAGRDGTLTPVFELVAEDWARSLDNRRKPGREALAAVKHALGRAYQSEK